jgi:hypothetical protein
MRYTKWFASFALAAGMAVMGTTAASAQDWRDLRHDYNRVDRLRDLIARDRARLAADMRYGNRWAVARDRDALERHETELRVMLRETRRDWRDDRGYNGAYTNGYNGAYNNGYNDYRVPRR